MATNITELKKIIAKAVGEEKEIYRLTDVLIAIDKKFPAEFYVDTNGEFIKRNNDGSLDNTYISWNFLKNNLDDQDEPTLKFLTDLLV